MALPNDPNLAPITMEDIQELVRQNPVANWQLQALAWRRVPLALEAKMEALNGRAREAQADDAQGQAHDGRDAHEQVGQEAKG